MGVVCWYANPKGVGGLVIHLGSWTFASETSRPHLNKHVFIICYYIPVLYIVNKIEIEVSLAKLYTSGL